MTVAAVTDGLRPEQRESIRRVLAGFPELRRAVLFGSRATGRFRQGSDIDLALESADGAALELDLLLRIRGALAEIGMFVDIDVIDRASVTSRELEDEIASEGVEFWDRKSHPAAGSGTAMAR